MRAASYYSPMSNFQDRIAGIGFYQLLKDLDENFDEKKAELIKNLQILMKYIFRKENLTVSYTCLLYTSGLTLHDGGRGLFVVCNWGVQTTEMFFNTF